MRKVIIGIYMIQNKIDGKIYIGQSKDIYKRWKQHIIRSNHPVTPIQWAINSYGKDNFSFSILEECLENELNDRESFYIKLYHSIDKDFGYNLLQGGNQCKWTKEMKEKQSKILKEVHNRDDFRKNSSLKMKAYWKEHKSEIIENRKNMYSDELKNKISKTCKNLWNDESYRKKVSESHKGNTYHKNKTLIRCIETNEVKSVFEWNRLGYNNAISVCKGKLKRTRGYSFEFVDESLIPTKEEIEKNLHDRSMKSNNRNKRLCLDPFTKLPLSYGSLCRKKQTKDEYKNINLQECLIDDEYLEYYENLRKSIRTMPYTYSSVEERQRNWKCKNKEKEKERCKRKSSRLCLDPITNEIIKYSILQYRKKTRIEYKNITLKDCVI